MLTRFRIEVEEQTIAETVEALAKYEHALVATEAQRYWEQWPHWYEQRGPDREPTELDDRSTFTKWDMPMEQRDFFIEELGVEVTDEVIEMVEPGLYKGRRVVQLVRIDGRSSSFIKLDSPSEWKLNTNVPGVQIGTANSGSS